VEVLINPKETFRRVDRTQGLNLHRTAQDTKTRAYIRASSGIRTHDPSVQTA